MKNEIILNNVSNTREWAAEFAKTLHTPTTVALHGDLGMGKSEIARTIIKTLCGADTVVPSPTFTIVQTYQAQGHKGTRPQGINISHFDLYRISDASELTEIGLEYATQNDITLIEWPDIALDILPNDTIHIYLTEHGSGRKLEIID